MAIAKTNSSGEFQFANLPSGEYDVYALLRGFFMTAAQQRISLGQSENLQMEITSADNFINIEISRVTSVTENIQHFELWHSILNQGQHFSLNSGNTITEFFIYNAYRQLIDVQHKLDPGNGKIKLILESSLSLGIYIFRWREKDTKEFLSQKILVSGR